MHPQKNKATRFDFPRSYDLAGHNMNVPAGDEIMLMDRVIRDLWLTNRTLVSDDYDLSLDYISKIIPIDTLCFPSGKEIFTWTVPEKWTVKEAWLKYNDKIICDFKQHPLHLVSYSTSFKGMISKEELKGHLYFDIDRPEAIPFVYKYYSRDWGFCISYEQFQKLPEGPFEVLIDTSFEDGFLKVGEYVLPGSSKESIVLCSHLCHPGQVNDGLSGIAIGIALMKRLEKLNSRYYTYRFVMCPENIGSITYLSSRQEEIPSLKYGIFLEMLGNKNQLKLQLSKKGNTVIDRIAEQILEENVSVYGVGPFRQVIANDEINFDGPGVNCSMISLSRWPYPEYHTSDDNPGIISLRYLNESLNIVWKIIEYMEKNVYPTSNYIGNVFLSKFGLYEDLNHDDTIEKILLSFDGKCNVLEISEYLGLPFSVVDSYVKKFLDAGLIKPMRSPFSNGQ